MDEDELLDELLENAPACWYDMGESRQVTAIKYVRSLEATLPLHREFCDGTCE